MLLTELFARTVARHPDRIAVDVPPGRERPVRWLASYAELAAMAATVRQRLLPLVDGEAAVAVLLPRSSPWLYAAQLGILQTGGAHVCLDAAFPLAHLLHVLRDCGAVALVTDAAGAAMVRAHVGERQLPVVLAPMAVAAAADPAPAARPHDAHRLAYAIYTSGTTGAPKAVLLEHAGAVNLIEQGVARFGLGPGDRVAQGSSPAYDSSIEETWLALASGATVVVLDDETVRLGPDLVPWLRRERITVFCPPPTLLRAMDCAAPRAELPDLRLCYVGGEPLPADLAEHWGAALWLENGYGPTECTVTVVRGRVWPGRPVTIGTPVPPHRALVLDERLQPVVDGDAGELCVHGIGLARGYLGQPELTAARFPTLPGIGRVYRTGDLVRRDAGGELVYLGRIDAQVKLRGYRIELEAVESVLARCEGVREVACTVQGEGAEGLLAAHVVPVSASSPPDFAGLAASVRHALPEYMVPTRFSLCVALPRNVSGKLDRKALPPIGERRPARAARAEPPDAGEVAVGPDAQAVAALRAAFAAVLGLAVEAIAPCDDFFALGGNSLRAAMLVSRLRRGGSGTTVTVRDVYEARTVLQLSALLARVAPAAPVSAPTQPLPKRSPMPARPRFATAVQTVWLLALLGVGSGVGYLLGFVLVPWLLTGFSLPVLAVLAPSLALGLTVVYAAITLGLAVAAKTLLIGRYRSLRVPAWSTFHLRHWLVVRTVRLVPWSLLQGTCLQVWALRALGARIGERVHLHRGVDLCGGGWDLLEIGDGATLGREVDLGLCELDGGDLVVGAVRIGAGATLATRAGTGAEVAIGAGAQVDALSYVGCGQTVPAGERWDGVPARRVDAAPAPARVDVPGRALSPRASSALLLTARLAWPPMTAGACVIATWLATVLGGVDAAAIARWLVLDGAWSRPLWLAVTVGAGLIGLPVSLLGRALFLRWTRPVPVGTHARWSSVHLRLEVRTEQLERAGEWLSGTLFWPHWLRLAGMRIGPDCEISTILDVLPEHVELGGQSFLADGVYLGVPRIHAGSVTVLPTALGERTFLGNHVVIDAGQRLAADVLLGVSTIADARRMTGGSAWFGHPAFALPQREIVRVDRRLTHAPGPLRIANRVFWEGLRLLVPALPLGLVLCWFDVVAAARPAGALALAGAVAAATFGYGAALAGVVLALKWLLLGRVRPGQHALWSCWASRWDFHYVVWHRYGRALLAQLEGTLWLPWYLRAMGMRIGRGVVLGDGFAQVVDPDMLTIEDGATVHAMFQAHSFEDRVLKIDRVRLGKGCTVGRGAVVLYGADIGDGAEVAPHSVVMKGELLLPHRRYQGVPTAEVADVPWPAAPAARAVGGG